MGSENPIPQDKACIQVHGANQSGSSLRIISDRDCRIWVSQMIQLQGCHALNPKTGKDTGMGRHVNARRTLDLVAGVPADLELGYPILIEGMYRNTVASPADGALLFSSGDSWPGYEAAWMMRMQPHG